MKTKTLVFFTILFTSIILLSGCSKSVENEHLPEYCQSYSGFMSTASKDLYDLLEDVNRSNYLSVISQIELEFEVDDPTKEIDLDGLQCFQNLTSLSLTGQSFKDISEISALKNIQKISLVDTHVVSIDSFKNLSKVNELTISNTKTLQSVTGVEEMTKLEYLDLSDNGIVNVEDLDQLVNLKELRLNNNEMISFPSISNLIYLETLILDDNNIVSLSNDLSGLIGLKTFSAKNNKIVEISALDTLTSLELLDLSNNNLGAVGDEISPDFSSLSSAPNLRELYLNDNNLTSIGGLSDKNLPLKILHLQNNEISDISPISGFTNLEELVLFNNLIDDITEISGMTSLVEINLSDNLIVDFEGLLQIPNIEFVNLSNNLVEEIPDITQWAHIVSINLDSNHLKDTSLVKGSLTLEELILTNNGLESLKGISDLPELRTLLLNRDTDALDFEIEDRPNAINVIHDSFNNLPNLNMVSDDNEFRFNFDITYGTEITITSSFNDISSIAKIDFSGLDIDSIDDASINLDNLVILDVSDNNISDISFVLGNPKLVALRISNNPINNLNVISGVTTTDLDLLEQIEANGITGNNDLDGAFNDLGNLTLIALADTNIISINDSFNNLDQLVTLNMGSGTVKSIVNSFNYLFATSTIENVIHFDGGQIERIENSFNGGLKDSTVYGFYHELSVLDQLPLITETVILDSFNNISVEGIAGIKIKNSLFKTVTNSFNGVVTDLFELDNNGIETITLSFVDAEISGVLNMRNNKIGDGSTLGLISSVFELDLSQNQLTSVTFIDGISDLVSLNIDSQKNEFDVSTLNEIVGINNMTTLNEVSFGNNNISLINGFKGIGITSFAMPYDTEQVNTFTINSGSFTGTSLTNLDLGDNLFLDVAFLNNLIGLQTLDINFDDDFSLFSDLPFESSLTSLIITSVDTNLDFSELDDYLLLTTLEVNSSITVLNNFNVSNVTNLTIANIANIITIENSFNNYSNVSGDMLSGFSSLANIVNSFDAVTTEVFEISEVINVTNSFNFAKTIEIDSPIGTSFIIDALSFDNIDSIFFTNAEYGNYAFLNSYTSLDNINIDSLKDNFIGLNNSSVDRITIKGLDESISEINYLANTNSSLLLASLKLTNTIIDTNSLNIYASLPNSDVTITTIKPVLNLSGIARDIIIDSNVVTTINNFNGTSSLYNVSNLAANNITIVSDVFSDYLASGNVLELDITSISNDLTVDNNSIANLTVSNDSLVTLDIDILGTIEINSLTTTLSGLINSNIAILNTSALADITLNSPIVSNLTVNSSLVNDINITNANIDNMYLDITETNIDFIGNVDNLYLNANNINDLTFLGSSTGSNLTLNTSNNQTLNYEVVANVAIINGLNIPNMVNKVALSDINDFDLSLTNLGSLAMGNSNITNLTLNSTKLSNTISGTNVGTVELTNNIATDYDIQINNGDFTLNTVQTNLDLLLKVDQFNLISGVLQTLLLDNNSVINTANLGSIASNTLTFNDGTINNLLFSTSSSALTISGSNLNSVSIGGNALTSITANLPGSILNINNTNTSPFNGDIIVEALDIDSSYSSITLQNSSVIPDITLQSPNLSSVILGTMVVNSLDIDNSSESLDITSNNLNSLSLTSSPVIGMTMSTPDLLDMTFQTTNSGILNISTTAKHVDINALNKSSITLDIDPTIVGVGNNTLKLRNSGNVDLTTSVTGLDVDGSNNVLEINGANLSSLNFVATSNINSLIINNTTLSNIDLNNASVSILNFEANTASFLAKLSGVNEVTVVSNVLNDFTIEDSNTLGTANINLTGLQTNLAYSGNVNNLVIGSSSLTTLNVNNSNIDNTILTTNNLNTINVTGGNIDDLTANTNNSTLNVSGPIRELTSTIGALGTLNFDTLETNVVVNGNIKTINVDAPNASLFITGSAEIFDITALSVDLTSTSVQPINIDNTSNNMIIDLSNATTLSIIGSVVNDIDITSPFLTSYDDSLSNGVVILRSSQNNVGISTLASDLTFSGSISANINIDVNENTVYNINSRNITTTNAVLKTKFDLNYVGNFSLNLVVNNVTTLNLSPSNTINNSFDNLNVSGTVDNFNLDASFGGSNFVFDSLVVNTLLNITGSDYFDVSFMTASLLTSVDTLNIQTLDQGSINTIVETLRDTLITLDSNISEAEFRNAYYLEEKLELSTQESVDNLRYDSLFNSEVNDILLNIFRVTESFDGITDIDLILEIENNNYQTMQEYFAAYLLNVGKSEDDLILEFNEDYVLDIKANITTALSNPNIVIDTDSISAAVLLQIETEANQFADDFMSAIGFTIVGGVS
ncbi:hypothetical protein CI105_01675 [Candidatus Izimaplasma bacterium ZiA1]|uniref:leucine-rich repeat domain-containing protein n=1 Tax=Candidatus Izimoplasma sp. ZiA1 TaxID=2024899 RepID=UPI000BAA928B|nr:hypothetical protein CI105_01675 [Candidatus Izimaplasma bacterium ZiA1]